MNTYNCFARHLFCLLLFFIIVLFFGENMNIIPFTSDMALNWDKYISNCPMGTFLHSRDFLSYHGERFKDQSLIISDENNQWLGVLPAAINPNDTRQVVSHPGITFGGLVHSGKLTGSAMVETIQTISSYYKRNGYSSFLYKAIPYYYHRTPSSDDLYALTRAKAQLCSRELSCVINLTQPTTMSNKNLSTMRNMIRKSEKNGVTIDFSKNKLKEFWEILSTHLKNKYQTVPTHTYDEIKLLMEKFPDNIKIITALLETKIIAGTILFHTNKVLHTQYLLNTKKGMELFALDTIIQNQIRCGREKGFTFFSFGTSNEKNGMILNSGLYESKAKHGGSGIVHDSYVLDLKV